MVPFNMYLSLFADDGFRGEKRDVDGATANTMIGGGIRCVDLVDFWD